MAGVRMDKWLWAARFFKTRSIAAKACDLGRVESNGIVAKPAREARVGDRLRIRTPAAEFEVEVLLTSEMRGPAAVAATLYRETEASAAARARLAGERKAGLHSDGFTDGRPSKRDRRRIGRLSGRYS
ncbi:MAG: RNA-binding S4 domain-containing protein [Bryobacteraceae bacterium]